MGNDANVDSGLGLNLPRLTTTPLNFSKTIRATASPMERSGNGNLSQVKGTRTPVAQQ